MRDPEDEVVFGFDGADGGSWMFRPRMVFRAVGVALPQLPSRLMRFRAMSILQADPAGP